MSMNNILQRLKDAISEDNGAKIITAAKEVAEAAGKTIMELPDEDSRVFEIGGFYCSICRKTHCRIIVKTFDYSMAREIGKTVFITRPEAEKALERSQSHE